MAAADQIKAIGSGIAVSWFDVDLTSTFTTDEVPFASQGYTHAMMTYVRNAAISGGSGPSLAVQGNIRWEEGAAASWRAISQYREGTFDSSSNNLSVAAGAVGLFSSDSDSLIDLVAFKELRLAYTFSVAPSAGSLHELTLVLYKR